jgi:hypothetical protein
MAKLSEATRRRIRQQEGMREKQAACNEAGAQTLGGALGMAKELKEPNQIDFMKNEVSLRDDYIAELEAEVLDLYRRINSYDRPSRPY